MNNVNTHALPFESFEAIASTSRRDMLKNFALGSAAMLLSPNTLLSATSRKKEKLGVALVGLGYYSTDLLAPALQQTKNCYLAGIVTGTPLKWKCGRQNSIYLEKIFIIIRTLTRLPTMQISMSCTLYCLRPCTVNM